jgi:glycosyltransferase involved in cell wall biosynthesis
MLSLGVVPVVTDQGGLPEIVSAAGVGVVCRGRDEESLAAGMRDALERYAETPGIRESARLAWKTHFSLEAAGERWASILADVE